jgi:hypothetical protein
MAAGTEEEFHLGFFFIKINTLWYCKESFVIRSYGSYPSRTPSILCWYKWFKNFYRPPSSPDLTFSGNTLRTTSTSFCCRRSRWAHDKNHIRMCSNLTTVLYKRWRGGVITSLLWRVSVQNGTGVPRNGYRDSFQGEKPPGRGVEHLTPKLNKAYCYTSTYRLGLHGIF